MVIKFIDKFESIFYAVLFSNLTGHYIAPKKKNWDLFKNEPYIDIDNLNWQEILKEHNARYGEIRWLKQQNEFSRFKNFISNILKGNSKGKYQIIINAIKKALKFGPNHTFAGN
jgi:hypothetical protein